MGDISVKPRKEITPEDEEKIWSWNARLPPTPQLTIAEVFSNQVTKSPNAPAVDAPDGTLTYDELDNYSTRLALHLRIILNDINVDEVVPICFDKSIWLIVSMMAVSKARMAYTTLDPKNPTERLRACLSAVSPRVMLADSKFGDRFSQIGARILTDVPETCIIPDSKERQTIDLPVGLPEDLSYVCFTSGSTGLPKVVEHTQSSAVMNVVYGDGFAGGSRVLNFASQGFAASVVMALKTLCNGGLLVLPPERERMGSIESFIARKNITQTFLTPTLLSLLNPDDVSCLKFLTIGGESVPERLIKIWAPRLSFMDASGMTEGVSISNICDSTTGKKCRARQTMLGCAWIVDPDDVNTLAPIGAAGELLFEGPALCRGYRNNPEANTKAFIKELPAWTKNRGGDRPGILFRTGDLAKYVEDGVVQIVGRKDSRVKLYGQRFELGEVEIAILACLPLGVTVAAEIVEPTDGNGPMLVAFVYGLPTGLSSEARAIREKLSGTLPDYMIPRGFVELKEQPLNPSGKLDRKLLRQRGAAMQLAELIKYTGSSEKVAPVTPQEKEMQRLWATVLGLPIESIGLNDEFFYLGGTSLHCIRLIAEAQKCGVGLSFEDMLEHRTLQAISGAATFGVSFDTPMSESEDQTYTIGSITSNIPQADVEAVMRATDWQAWCIGQGLLKSHGWHDYMIFKFSRALNVEKLRTACQQLLDRHAILRTVFVVNTRRTFQAILKPKAYPFRFVVKEPVDGQNAEDYIQTIIQEDMKRRTHLGDLLVAFTLVLNVSDTTHKLILRISHAQYDGLSVGKLWRSLETLYLGEPLEVVPFTKFCAEAALASSKSESFWKKTLANTSMSEVITHNRPSVEHPIDSAIKASIPLVDLKALGFTSATAVLASWSIVLSRLTCVNSVLFGYITSGRDLPMPGISDVMGPCMSILPLHADVSPVTTISSLLSSVQSTYLKALQHGHLGHRHIIENCTGWPRWTRFSTIVNHLGFEHDNLPFSKYGESGFEVYEPAHDKADLWLQTLVRGSELEIELRYSATALSEDWVKAVLDNFVSVYHRLPNGLNTQIAENLLQMKTPASQKAPAGGTPYLEETLPPLAEDAKVVEAMVLSSWEAVLGSDFRSHAGFSSSQTPFFEIWGSEIAAAALAAEYSKRGFSISCEKVLNYASLAATVAHLSKHFTGDGQSESQGSST
ncbi:hypothetical protein NX059_010006 [Plenodomus lindquistii]|nr:hypothetical protein NX059_010006 [Plenodomus lindquistii]